MPAAAVAVGTTLFSASQQRQAASQQRDAMMAAAETQAASDAAALRESRFRPVGTTNRFGTSQFGFDSEGRLTSGGYSLSPELKGYQDTLMGVAPQFLQQFTESQQRTAPMMAASGGMMQLGSRYLSTDPVEQARKYMGDMQAVLAAPRAAEYAKIRERLNATGRTGLAIGGDAGMLAANPEMAAYYNSIAQQDRELAQQATEGGMNYAKFGSGMIGSGADMLKTAYGTQQAAYNPFATAIGGAGSMEEMGRSAFDTGMQMGKSSQVGYNPSTAMSQGMVAGANIMANVKPVDWGAMASGAASAYQDWRKPNVPVEDRPVPSSSSMWT